MWVAQNFAGQILTCFYGGWTWIQCQLWNSYKPWLQNVSTKKQLDSLRSTHMCHHLADTVYFSLRLSYTAVESLGCSH